jgi:hypothetical protein
MLSERNLGVFFRSYGEKLPLTKNFVLGSERVPSPQQPEHEMQQQQHQQQQQHELRTVKVKLFASASMSMEESYLVKRFLR